MTTYDEARPGRIIIREVPGNWRIEYRGDLQASAECRGSAIAFGISWARNMNGDGILTRLYIIEDGVQKLCWEPGDDPADDDL